MIVSPLKGLIALDLKKKSHTRFCCTMPTVTELAHSICTHTNTRKFLSWTFQFNFNFATNYYFLVLRW